MIYNDIVRHTAAAEKMLVRLIDPEKFNPDTLGEGFSCYFVGGSTASGCEQVVDCIHARTATPVVLFPGNVSQFTPNADALLFLTLMNSRDPRFLLDAQVAAARAIHDSGIETIPMGYILLDGGKQSAVERVTGCTAVGQDDIDNIIRLAVAAEMMGKKTVYLEAGSGALQPVRVQVIRSVREHIRVPLIVGGGIRTVGQMKEAFDAGADMVVIGNHFEEHPEDIPLFTEAFRTMR